MKRATMPQFEDLLLSLQLKHLEDEALLDFWEESQTPITPVINIKQLKHVRSMQKNLSNRMATLPKNPLTELVTALQKKQEALATKNIATETGFEIEIESEFTEEEFLENLEQEFGQKFIDEALSDIADLSDISAISDFTKNTDISNFDQALAEKKAAVATLDFILDEPYLPAELEELLVNFAPQSANSSTDTNHTRVMAIPLYYLQGKQHHHDYAFSKQERLILQELQLRSVMRATGNTK